MRVGGGGRERVCVGKESPTGKEEGRKEVNKKGREGWSELVWKEIVRYSQESEE